MICFYVILCLVEIQATCMWNMLHKPHEKYLLIGQKDIPSLIEPIRGNVTKSSLCKNLRCNIINSLIIIGFTDKHFMILTNQNLFLILTR